MKQVQNIESTNLMRHIFQIAIIASFMTSTIAHAGILLVRAERPDWFKMITQNKAWNIVLEGEIDLGAPARVAEALKKAGSDGADVYISSPGGNLLAGMQIGRLIRHAGANTHIGTLVADPSNSFDGKAGVKPMPGRCFSACTLAFIGGVYRYATKASEYGVHRFSSRSRPTDNDLDTAQVISAAIGAYIREMDVDPSLFDLMVQEGKGGIRILNNVDLTRLNVVNNGRKKPEWSIEAIEGGQYLRGVQESVYGQGKAVLFCYNRHILYQSHYEVGAEKAKSIASGGWYHSLFVDGKTVPLPDPVQAKASGDEIVSQFFLTRDQALAIASSSSTGHAMQLSREAPTFVGYNIDIPVSASQKVGAFIRNCLAPSAQSPGTQVAVGVYPPTPAAPTTLRNSMGMEFVRIEAGTFQMGSNDSEAMPTGYDDRQPVHTVRLTQPFYLGKYEVTQGQWQAVMGTNPSEFTGDSNRPVENVSWDDVQEFIRRLNSREGGAMYRLPTEAEWEYAARAGTTTRWSFGDDARQLGRYAWYNENAGGQTHPVGQLQPNPWGLYDMDGNVEEWVQDWKGKYTSGTAVDPAGPSSGSFRVIRGGGLRHAALGCRLAFRWTAHPGGRSDDLGFRLLRVAQ